jgi:hypothetical protein
MKKTLTTENIRMGQLLVLKKTSVGYNTFGNDVYMYLEPCIEDWGYQSKNIVYTLDVITLNKLILGLSHLRKA